MAQDKREPTEKTPNGFEVPVPKRREFFSNLKKIAGKPVTTREWKDAAGRGSTMRSPKK